MGVFRGFEGKLCNHADNHGMNLVAFLWIFSRVNMSLGQTKLITCFLDTAQNLTRVAGKGFFFGFFKS